MAVKIPPKPGEPAYEIKKKKTAEETEPEYISPPKPGEPAYEEPKPSRKRKKAKKKRTKGKKRKRRKKWKSPPKPGEPAYFSQLELKPPAEWQTVQQFKPIEEEQGIVGKIKGGLGEVEQEYRDVLVYAGAMPRTEEERVREAPKIEKPVPSGFRSFKHYEREIQKRSQQLIKEKKYLDRRAERLRAKKKELQSYSTKALTRKEVMNVNRSIAAYNERAKRYEKRRSNYNKSVRSFLDFSGPYSRYQSELAARRELIESVPTLAETLRGAPAPVQAFTFPLYAGAGFLSLPYRIVGMAKPGPIGLGIEAGIAGATGLEISEAEKKALESHLEYQKEHPGYAAGALVADILAGWGIGKAVSGGAKLTGRGLRGIFRSIERGGKLPKLEAIEEGLGPFGKISRGLRERVTYPKVMPPEVKPTEISLMGAETPEERIWIGKTEQEIFPAKRWPIPKWLEKRLPFRKQLATWRRELGWKRPYRALEKVGERKEAVILESPEERTLAAAEAGRKRGYRTVRTILRERKKLGGRSFAQIEREMGEQIIPTKITFPVESLVPKAAGFGLGLIRPPIKPKPGVPEVVPPIKPKSELEYGLRLKPVSIPQKKLIKGEIVGQKEKISPVETIFEGEIAGQRERIRPFQELFGFEGVLPRALSEEFEAQKAAQKQIPKLVQKIAAGRPLKFAKPSKLFPFPFKWPTKKYKIPTSGARKKKKWKFGEKWWPIGELI